MNKINAAVKKVILNELESNNLTDSGLFYLKNSVTVNAYCILFIVTV
jgi:hypothetical protein